MSWMKLDDQFHASRKLNSIPKRHRFQAAGLWAIAGSWVAGQETDGFVPTYMVKEWGPTEKTVQALVDAELWELAEGGYQFCRWLDYNPSKSDSERDRASSRERKKRSRERRKANSDDESMMNKTSTDDDSSDIQATNRRRIDDESTSNSPRIDDESTSNSPRIDDESTTNRPRIDTETVFNNSQSAVQGGSKETCHGVTHRNVTDDVTRDRGRGVTAPRPDPTRPLSPNGDKHTPKPPQGGAGGAGAPAKTSPAKHTQSDYPDAFEAWWALWPKKQSKRAALKAWTNARKRIDDTTLAERTKAQVAAYQRDRTEPRYIPHPATWLNNDGWENDLSPAQNAHRPTNGFATAAARLRAQNTPHQQRMELPQ